MSAQTLSQLSNLFFILAGVSIGISSLLYFLLDVPRLFGYVTGRTARKAISRMETPETTTGSMQKTAGKGVMVRNLRTGEDMPQMAGEEAEATELLPEETPATQLLTEEPEATQLLPEETQETQLLVEEPEASQMFNQTPEPDFQIEAELTFTDSHEIIE